MTLAGKSVTFRLSPEGQAALGTTFEKPSFRASVEEVDELGAWILVADGTSLLLLKWDYFSTAVVDYEVPELPVERRTMGFIS